MLTAAFLWHATSVYRGVEEGLQPDINIWTHLETIKFLYPASLPYIKEFNSTSQQSTNHTQSCTQYTCTYEVYMKAKNCIDFM